MAFDVEGLRSWAAVLQDNKRARVAAKAECHKCQEILMKVGAASDAVSS